MREYAYSSENAMETLRLSLPHENNRAAYCILSAVLCTVILHK